MLPKRRRGDAPRTEIGGKRLFEGAGARTPSTANTSAVDLYRTITACIVLLIACVPGTAFADTPCAADQEASSDRIASAWGHLARGEAKRAYREFAQELPFWDTFQRQSLGYIDCERGMMIAAIFMRDDTRANAMWRKIGGESLEPKADRLIFAARWNDAFRA
jgi:hypothetical protein